MKLSIEEIKKILDACYVEAECGFQGYSAKTIKPIYDNAVLLELEANRLRWAAQDAYERQYKSEAQEEREQEERE